MESTAVRAKLGHVCSVLLLFMSACSSGPRRGYALYPEDPASKSIEEVAQISTQLRAVNDTKVPEGVSRVEVLPGCHVVHLAKEWIFVENGAYGYMKTDGLVVNIQAEAGYLYVVDLRFGAPQAGNTMSSRWSFHRFDSKGEEVPGWEPLETCPK